MKKFKISDGILRKIGKRFLKVLKKEYASDGLYVYVDEVHISSWENNDFSVEMSIRWGRTADGNEGFHHTARINLLDGNIHSLIGQFYEKILNADGNK